ncbi:hypothetical protein [Ruminococcus albus]|uniref:DUF2383 domain-containing protein n=1 Tax=Ruminococcus albus TaxID=1264 RepID=A0A1H7GH61_RUMAL|nr:hypothetical protein [Ruminococcus albus]SEK37503.1 hypothetical protein SAMN05216469_102108 [Ruminococcus albus]
MIEKDTVRLLRECDAGAKMGVSSIEDTMEFRLSEPLKNILEHSRKQHLEMSREINDRLAKFGDDGKDPPMMAEVMGKIKANFKLVTDDTDKAAAEFITDGCNMGIKSLSGYLNEFGAAEEYSKDITKKLIAMEEELARALRGFL